MVLVLWSSGMLVVMYVGRFSGLFATQEDLVDMSRGSETQYSINQHGLCFDVGRKTRGACRGAGYLVNPTATL
jgi:hypothetical protein